VRTPQRYEIIQLFDRSSEQFFIKRVVGLPGETVMIKHDGVYVQLTTGVTMKLDESYLPTDTRTTVLPGQRTTTIHVPDNAYYVLGDNRLHSSDSREFGAVHRRYIQGKVFSFLD
jgi:signal peptidase I